ncbi:MAG: DUF1801 domain-containing protein [Ferruginibacter sp.]|nr:DUF1801 domain-containing protein [Ferruginibacter sp.]
MQSTAISTEQYLIELPADRQEAMSKLRKEILENLPKGFKEEMNYGMIGYVVPHTLYPPGYHCDPKLPLPFMNIASQKKFIAVYHMGVYGDKKLLDWFLKEYAKSTTVKLDMGKSCIRFKKMDTIPYTLIGELAGKITVADWIRIYEENVKR